MDKRKVFHSFRHSFKDACRDSGIPVDVHEAITGHAPGHVGGGHGRGFTVERLADEMAKLRYRRLDLSNLKWAPK
jgi:integrase